MHSEIVEKDRSLHHAGSGAALIPVNITFYISGTEGHIDRPQSRFDRLLIKIHGSRHSIRGRQPG